MIGWQYEFPWSTVYKIQNVLIDVNPSKRYQVPINHMIFWNSIQLIQFHLFLIGIANQTLQYLIPRLKSLLSYAYNSKDNLFQKLFEFFIQFIKFLSKTNNFQYQISRFIHKYRLIFHIFDTLKQSLPIFFIVSYHNSQYSLPFVRF